jgi:hypothetical protein
MHVGHVRRVAASCFPFAMHRIIATTDPCRPSERRLSPDAGLRPQRPRSPDAPSRHPSAGIAEGRSCSRHSFASGGIVQRRTQRKRDGRRLFIFFEPPALLRTAFSRRNPPRPVHPLAHRASAPGSDRMTDGKTADLRAAASSAFRSDGRPQRRPHARGRHRSARARQKKWAGECPRPASSPVMSMASETGCPSLACAQNSMLH